MESCSDVNGNVSTFCEDLDLIVTGAVYIFMKILIYVACLIMRSCTSLL